MYNMQQTKQQEVEAFVKQVQGEDGETQVKFLTMTEDPEIFRGLLSDAYVDEALIRKGIKTVEEINSKYKEETTEEFMKRMEKEMSN